MIPAVGGAEHDGVLMCAQVSTCFGEVQGGREQRGASRLPCLVGMQRRAVGMVSIPKSLRLPGSLLCPSSLDGHGFDLNRCRFAPEECKVAFNFVSGGAGR